MDLKTKILNVALDLAGRFGIAATTRDAIAAKADCSSGSVSFHYGDKRELQREIVREAIRRERLDVLGWAVSHRHPTAMAAPEELRARAIRHHLSIK